MKTLIRIKMQRIGDQGYHPIIKIRINGVEVRVVVDTGASRTIFDHNKIQVIMEGEKQKQENSVSAGLGTSTMRSSTLRIRTLQLGGFKLRNYKTYVCDLQHIHDSYTADGVEHIHGVIGSDILRKFKAEICYRRKRLTLYDDSL